MSGEVLSKYTRAWPPAAADESRATAAERPSAGRPAADLRAALRARGMRVTPQRLAVHGALHALGRHSTAEEVLERVHGTVPGVSLPTVYAALELLADLDADVELGPALEQARALGAQAAAAEVTVRGLCADCAA